MAICQKCGAEFNEGAGWDSHTCEIKPSEAEETETTSDNSEETNENGGG